MTSPRAARMPSFTAGAKPRFVASASTREGKKLLVPGDYAYAEVGRLDPEGSGSAAGEIVPGVSQDSASFQLIHWQSIENQLLHYLFVISSEILVLLIVERFGSGQRGEEVVLIGQRALLNGLILK